MDEPDFGRRTVAAAVVLTAALIVQLDIFIVSIAMPAVQRAFPSAGLPLLSWVLNAFTVVFAACLVPAGRLADHLGRRRALLAGVVLFGVASAACAAAPSAAALIASRAIQAVGAAVLMPTSLGLLLALYRRERHPLIVGVWAAMSGSAAAFGPTVGGVLVLAGSWRYIFLINVPLAAAVLLAARRLVPDDRPERPGRLPDPVAAVGVLVAVGSLVLGIVEGSSWSWDSVRFAVTLAVSVAATSLVAVRARTHPRPLIEAALLRVPEFAAANAAVVAYYIAYSVMILGSVFLMAGVWHYSVLRTGLGFAPGPVVSTTCAMFSGPLTLRIGRRALAVTGSAALAASFAWWIVGVTTAPNYLVGYLPGVLIAGIGAGCAQAPMFATVSALPSVRSATGSAVLTMLRQAASAVGVAALVAILGTGAVHVHRLRVAWELALACSIVAGTVCVTFLRGRATALDAAAPADAPVPLPATGEPLPAPAIAVTTATPRTCEQRAAPPLRTDRRS